MAEGARTVLDAHVGLATTGVAGPEGHDGKPVGTVYVGVATAAGTSAFEYAFEGNRAEIRGLACGAALERLLEALSG
jgi:nicotinamide-nucleotide amidase